MFKRVFLIIAILAMVILSGAYVFCQEPAAEEKAHPPTKPGRPTEVQVALALSIGFSLAIAVFGGAFGQSRAIVATVEAIARQPEASGKIFAPFIIGLALIESLVIYMLVVSILLLFVKFA